MKFLQMMLISIRSQILRPHAQARMSSLFYSSQPQAEARQVRNSKGNLYITDFQNESFERFYRSQAVCSEAEFPAMMAACRSGLPSVFRVIKNKPNWKLIIEKLKSGHLSKLGAKCVDWYGESLVWRLDKTRWDLMDSDKGDVKALHKWIVEQDRLGNIYRQEQVSMVPVRCLDIKPQHVVLDMCASPGSKTGQVLEALHDTEEGQPSGAVIACEPNLVRCNNLYGNMAEMRSPCLMVVHHPGQAFPDLTWSSGEPVIYDHIVCDVPCSGDGTIRKNPNIWAEWNPARGNGRFNLQLNIARRGVELLKEGGTMAYSSCSINQIENEAVMAQLLREAGGNLELVDMAGRFSGLEWLPGLSDWRVCDTSLVEYEDISQVPDNLKSQIRKEMFPPKEEEKEEFKLERSMRFLPHLNDDGGFYVAILKKTGPIEPIPKSKERTERKLSEKRKKKFNKPKYDDFVRSVKDFQFVNENSDHCEKVQRSINFLGLDLRTENLYKTRDSVNTVRLVSDSVKNLMHDGNAHLEIGANPGVPILSKCDMKISDKVPYTPKNTAFHRLSFNSSRKVECGANDIERFLRSDEVILLSELSDHLLAQLSQLEPGWIVFSFMGSGDVSLTCPGYFSRQKLILNLGEKDKSHYKFLLDLR